MPPVKLGYRHLETDFEFRQRLDPDLNTWCRSLAMRMWGPELDTFMWDTLRKQRRIIEVFE